MKSLRTIRQQSFHWEEVMVGIGKCIWLNVRCVHKLKGDENEPCSQIQQPLETCWEAKMQESKAKLCCGAILSFLTK
jgi:hypothetical protein